VWLANTLTLSRIPLGILFAVLAGNTPVALALLLIGGATDIADGMVARRWIAPGSKAAAIGAWLDPTCDKIFLGCALFGIYLETELETTVIALVLMREILQIIALSVMAVRRIRPAAAGTRYDFRATRTGKATTVVQITFAATALLHLPASMSIALAGLAAGLGAASVWLYIRRYFAECR
jgi:CDP-diacylglycerol---glycerol-3-phosphate 3-phosphatidyltransferase